MLAVLPGYRDRNIGRDLKLAQRDAALKMGIRRMTWTFDPLQSKNAFLNFTKLGVVSNVYKRDFYGETSSFLHALGTDRLWVSWMLDEPRRTVRGTPRFIEAPRDVGSLPRDEALQWRARVRREFEEAFGEGYTAIDFDREKSAYVLVKSA
jgi:predicted GNAT superfamily acetyltransferase